MSLNEIYTKYNSDIQFMMIYVREAHPTDKWSLAETKFMTLVGELFNTYVRYDIKEPETIDERRQVALTCQKQLLEGIPVYVDNMENTIERQYVGWPTRIYFIDEAGSVIYESGIGPFGINYQEFESSIEDHLKK